MSFRFGGDRPKVDTRLQKAGKYTASTGTSKHYFEFEFDCLFNGLQVFSTNANLGDTVSLEVQYNYGGAWKRYKKFGKEWFIFPNNILDIISVPSEPKDGMRIEFEYNNTGESSVDIFVNIYTYYDQTTINVAAGQEGEDW